MPERRKRDSSFAQATADKNKREMAVCDRLDSGGRRFFGCLKSARHDTSMAMVRSFEGEPAQETQKWNEIRINRAALSAVEAWSTALKVCEYSGRRFPVEFPEESYDYIKGLLTQRQLEL